MLECNRYIHKKITVLTRIVSLLLPIVCVILLMSQVVFAKNTYLINDGDRVVVHTTYETDPIEVLTEAGLELGKDDTYTTQSGVGMSEITIQRIQTVEIIRGGNTTTVTTYGETVGALLARFDIVLSERDTVSVKLDSNTYDGLKVVINCSVTLEETYTVSTPFETLYCLDTSLAAGEQKILVPGVEGQIQYVDSVIYQDGQEADRTNLSSLMVSEPVAQLIAVGSLGGIDEDSLLEHQTKEEIRSVASYLTGNGQLYISDGLIITADGEILTYSDTMQVKATAYTHTDAGCDMITATGTTVRVGTVAVDPKVIPYGTRMFIVTNDGTYVYGIAVAEDCGSAIKENRVDLYFPTDAECWQFGVRQATIYFLGA